MNTQSLFADAEKMDARVCVRHERYAELGHNLFDIVGTTAELHALGLKPSGKGGETLVLLVDREGRYEPILGSARCRRDENFNKKLGLRIALGRALKKAYGPDGAGRERYLSKMTQVVIDAIAEVFPPQTEVLVFDVEQESSGWIYPELLNGFEPYPEQVAADEARGF